MTFTYRVLVGFTNTRPIVPDEFQHPVLVLADTDHEACTVAAQIVGCHAEMVTSTTIIAVEL